MVENEITDKAIYNAALDLQTAIALECGKLADNLLGRPELGSPEWFAAKEADPAVRQAELLEWHMCKLRICRAAKVSMTGDVVNARRYGATWQSIADVCGITRQGAFDRWARFTSALTTPEDDAR